MGKLSIVSHIVAIVAFIVGLSFAFCIGIEPAHSTSLHSMRMVTGAAFAICLVCYMVGNVAEDAYQRVQRARAL